MMPTRRCLALLYRLSVLVAAGGTLACGSLFDGVSGRRESCEIIRIGKSASGQVVQLVDTGMTINDDLVVEFVLRITPPVGEPYEARTKALVSRLDIPAIQPGRVFPVKYDPQLPTRVAIDLWECPKR